MSDLIQWPQAKYWTATYNPVIGCMPVSEGCENCYAETMVKRFGMNNGSFEPRYMLRAKAPKKGIVFVGNMTDSFGEWVSDSKLLFFMFRLNENAVNLILTKRSSRLAIASSRTWTSSIAAGHAWFGVTCENQARADERIPDLIKANVRHRWLSLEPLLGAIDLGEYFPTLDDNGYQINQLTAKNINWVVIGAESGPNRRECKVEWVESIVDQCQAAKVKVFVKQLHIGNKLVTDINKFPENLRIRQVPWAGR